MFAKSLLIILCIVQWTGAVVSEAGCHLEVKNSLGPLPLELGTTKVLYPRANRSGTYIPLEEAQDIELFCPGSSLLSKSRTYKEINTAKCQSGKLIIENVEHDYSTLNCSGRFTGTAFETGNLCENNGKEVKIGYQIDDGRLVNLIQICFDERIQQALYSHVVLSASINQRIQGTARPNWHNSGNIFSIPNPDHYYTRTMQRQTINTLLGLTKNSTKYIQDNNYFLSRGHMTARSENFYPGQQNLSFYIVNTAPQWQTDNAGNWETTEKSVRDLAEKKNLNLQLYTGVYGVDTLPHEETGEAIKLYLYVNNGVSAMPIPELYWKLVYEPISKEGVVLIVINNPYVDSYTPVCEDIQDQLSWVNYNKNTEASGFAYACSVDSFRQVVEYFPPLEVNGILRD